jgi:cytochrome P450
MAKAFYNIYLHPLSSYPGPKLWTCNNLVFAYHNIKGDIHLHVASMHAEYGHIVRVNANALSYTSAEAWNDIYTLTRNKTELQRNPIFSLPKGAAGIFQCPSHEDHTRMRKVLRPAFSEKAMRDQGPTIVSYIDLLMTRLKERAGNGSVDMANWYTFTTFDVMGALTFGEDFDCLKESKYHEWCACVSPELPVVYADMDGIGSIRFSSSHVQLLLVPW